MACKCQKQVWACRLLQPALVGLIAFVQRTELLFCKATKRCSPFQNIRARHANKLSNLPFPTFKTSHLLTQSTMNGSHLQRSLPIHTRNGNMPDESEPSHFSLPQKREAATAFPGDSQRLPSPPFSPFHDAVMLPSRLTPRSIATMPPEPESINAILRKHSRARLYVHPVGWTQSQPHLLGCRFVRRKPCSRKPDNVEICAEKEPISRPEDPELLQKRIGIINDLRQPSIASFKKSMVEALIQTYHVQPQE